MKSVKLSGVTDTSDEVGRSSGSPAEVAGELLKLPEGFSGLAGGLQDFGTSSETSLTLVYLSHSSEAARVSA